MQGSNNFNQGSNNNSSRNPNINAPNNYSTNTANTKNQEATPININPDNYRTPESKKTIQCNSPEFEKKMAKAGIPDISKPVSS